MSDHYKRYLAVVVKTAIEQLKQASGKLYNERSKSHSYVTQLFELSKLLKKSPINLTESEIGKMFYIGNYGGKFDSFTLYCGKVLYNTGFVIRSTSKVFTDAVENNGYSDTSSDLSVAFYDQFTKYLAKEVKTYGFKTMIKDGKTSNQLAGRKVTVPSKTHNCKKIYPPFVNVRKML